MSERLPVLSIIIVAYKSCDEIGNCLASIPSDLGGRDIETIVVDNNSQDGTQAFVETLYPHVVFIDPGENLGFGRANNLGYKNATGEHILFLNPDTICNREALEHCIHRLSNEPAIGLLSPKLVMADGEMDLACRRSIPNLWDGFCRASGLAAKFPRSRRFAGYNLTHLPAEQTYEVGAINGAFMMTRRDALEQVGLFDESFFMYGDDLDLCYRFTLAGFRIVYDGRHSITHLKGLSVSKDYDTMSKAIFDTNKAFFLKHFNPKDKLIIRWKYDLAFGLWKFISRFRAKVRGSRRVKPL